MRFIFSELPSNSLKAVSIFITFFLFYSFISTNQAYSQPACNGLIPTIVGTEGDNVINGTNGNDVIVGFGGNDTINGGNGDDVICGGNGNDTLSGNNGTDTLIGGSGSDILSGNNWG